MCLIPLIRLLSPITVERQSLNKKPPAPREQMTPHAGSLLNLRRSQPPLSPANDDGRRSPAAMLRALDVRSNRAAIRVAALVSVVWAVAGPRCRQPALWTADLADPHAERSRRHPGCSRRRHRHRAAHHALLLLRRHDRPCAGTAQRRALPWLKVCAAPGRAGNRSSRPGHDRRSGRSPRKSRR